MPCISGQFDPRQGILLPTGVLPPGVLEVSPADLKIQSSPALVDTGASHSCISEMIVKALGLVPIGMTDVSGVHGAKACPQFLIDLVITFGATRFVQRGLRVTQFEIDAGAPFQILLGRDVLCRGALTISHDGHYTFCL